MIMKCETSEHSIAATLRYTGERRQTEVEFSLGYHGGEGRGSCRVTTGISYGIKAGEVGNGGNEEVNDGIGPMD
jgi:hypothetical protein